MQRGDYIWVRARVDRVAKDGSYLEVRVPTMPPKNASGVNWTAVKRKDEDGIGWTKAVRVPYIDLWLRSE